jgi:hypothetical protein
MSGNTIAGKQQITNLCYNKKKGWGYKPNPTTGYNPMQHYFTILVYITPPLAEPKQPKPLCTPPW